MDNGHDVQDKDKPNDKPNDKTNDKDKHKYKNDREEMRIGVFICDCGTNIAGVVDVPELVKFARTMNGVVFAEEGKWICSVDYLTKIKEYISEHDLNRVVVACCTPRTHEPTFKTTVKEAGLNPFLLEFVSIREQSSWVHQDDPKLATEVARDLVQMGVAKARYLEPGEEIQIPVGKECLVIGGGIAGITAALTLADLGFKIFLVERTGSLGGLLNRLHKLAPSDMVAREFLSTKLDRAEQHENITIFLDTEVADIKGYIGNFNIKLVGRYNENKPHLEEDIFECVVSTIIVATGMEEIERLGMFGYGKYSNVLTQLQFEELLKNNDPRLAKMKNVAFINCVNSRDTECGCCNIGCLSSIKNMKIVKELNEEINVYLFYRDLTITGMDVQYHYDSMGQIAASFRYPDSAPPVVQPKGTVENNRQLTVQSYDILMGEEVKVEVDMVVLATGFKGNSTTEQLKGLLKVSTNHDGFFIEAHVKLRPLDFASDGIYICGAARSPKSVRECLEESMGAAMRAAIPMNKGYVETEGIVADINSDLCIGCGICTEVCAFGAVELIDIAFDIDIDNIINNKPEVIKAICKGCGTCAASCPTQAINIVHYSDEQIMAQIDMALANNNKTESKGECEVECKDKVVVFACHWCALGAVDNAGVSRIQYPANLRIIRVMCSGRVDPAFILHAFSRGAAGVMVAGCEFPTCHYITGNYFAEKKVLLTKKLLELADINPERVRLEWLSAAEGAKFARVAKEFVTELDILGPVANDKFLAIDLQAALDSAKGKRLRVIAEKIMQFSADGNKYHEQFTEHEQNRLLSEIASDEFVCTKILLLLKDSNSSVKMLAKKMAVPPHKILRAIHDLIGSGVVRGAGQENSSPMYSLSPVQEIAVDSKGGAEVGEAGNGPLQVKNELPNKIKVEETQPGQNQITGNNRFDHVLVGTTISGLRKAVALAEAGNKVCVISAHTSFLPEPPILTKNFFDQTDHSKHMNEYSELIDRIYDHENITVIRNARLEDVSTGERGIRVQVHKIATYVDEGKCDNCGECSSACPVKILNFDAHGMVNEHAIYWPMPNSDRTKFAISKSIPNCQSSCPILMDARGYIGKLADGDIDGAVEVIQRSNPMPDICGKVCDHACEFTCARGYFDEPLEIRKLKRFAVEKYYELSEQAARPIISKPKLIINREPSNKVAIIGSGPAGLAAAHDLALLGYPVTIFEGQSVPGGMLRMGIPDYRLPADAVQREVQAIIDLGVELKLNTPIGPGLTISDLKAQGYKAIFIAVGAQKNIRLGIGGEHLEGVVSGLEFLREYNLGARGKTISPGQSVAVIGGGNTAMDTARTARRLGAENVYILYRRTKNEMPADDEELEQCIQEGIIIQYLVAPKSIIGDGEHADGGSGIVKAIECQRTELGEPDGSGRRRPVSVPGSEFTIDVDTILVAVGQEPDLGFLAVDDDIDLELTNRSTFVVDNRTLETNVDGVFAGGDALRGPGTVIGAIRDGKAAAGAIDRYLGGAPDDLDDPDLFEARKGSRISGEGRTTELELLRLKKNYLEDLPEEKRSRKPSKLLDAVKRITSFAEVELPLTRQEAVFEASRCLSCRMCIGCGVCQSVCPQDAIDYSMLDEHFEIDAKEVLQYPALEEGRFCDDNELKELYKNSMNVLTPMELEYMIKPGGVFDVDGRILRPYDGELPQNIAFINLSDKEMLNETQKSMSNLELEYLLRLVRYIKSNYPDIKPTLFTNSTELSAFPEGFEYLKDELVTVDDVSDNVKIVTQDEMKITELDDKTFEIETGDGIASFDLVVVASGLGFV